MLNSNVYIWLEISEYGFKTLLYIKENNEYDSDVVCTKVGMIWHC